MNSMDIIDWFDVKDVDHIRAFYVLSHTGVWPEGFIPEDMTFPHMWHYLLVNKMADNWIKHILKNKDLN